MKNILVTGGLGYIGSHTVVKLIEKGYKVIILDNLSNSKIKVLDNIEKITGTNPIFYPCDVRDATSLHDIMGVERITDVIHFAALKSVSDSISKPLEYYDNNVGGIVTLLMVMKEYNIKNIIFSSSCTVYGEPDDYPVNEVTPVKVPKTPYGVTKSMCEKILEDTTEINSIALRYFNPIGNHESGLIYENPNGVPENLMPYIIGVIEGKYEYLRVFGDDYNTPDGSAIRDYINVNDLAESHVKALNIVENKHHDVINVGTGNGVSVLEMIKGFKKQGYDVPYKILPRRNGDIEKIWADTTKCEKLLKWIPNRNIADSIKSILKSTLIRNKTI